MNRPLIDRPHRAPRFARTMLGPVQRFIRREAAGAILLVAATVIALAWANSTLASSYFAFWEIPLTFGFGEWALSNTLHHWINDALMAVFFFLVGLEIKREVLVGELSTPRQAALPLIAAAGGMIVPAAFYALFNAGTPDIGGWGVPMATDIAFALGVVTLLRDRVPAALKVFLVALAIADDLGAVFVIALFYTPDVSVSALLVALLFLIALVAANVLAVRRPWIYLLLGIGLWIAILQSGIHATIAGVLSALTIPARRRIEATEFSAGAHALLDEFDHELESGIRRPTAVQREALFHLEEAIEAVDTPLTRIEHWLHPWVAFAIIPLFALANAGVAMSGAFLGSLFDPLGLGILAGLFLGKQVGVTLFAWLAVRLGIAALPPNVRWIQLYGVAALCGIGFTMSLFIANLAFADAARLDTAKAAILIASLVSGAWGAFVLMRVARRA